MVASQSYGRPVGPIDGFQPSSLADCNTTLQPTQIRWAGPDQRPLQRARRWQSSCCGPGHRKQAVRRGDEVPAITVATASDVQPA